MHVTLTQLQGYNIMFKLLKSYCKETNSDLEWRLLAAMYFLDDGGTADPAIWHDWINATHDKKILTKQEAFEGMIRFFGIYNEVGPSVGSKAFMDEICLAKDCNDVRFPLVRQWNLYLKEVLSEPEGTREYLKLIK